MSFGFSLGDFFAVGQLAWNVYKSCKGAGGAFEEISHEVVALHTAIKELEDEIENPDSILNRTGAGKKAELGVLVKNCTSVLQQLNKLLTKYKSLGTTSKRTWDRLRWGAENLQEIREKLLTHTSSLTLFLTTLGTGSLGRIEKKLDQLIQDVRAGRREETVVTFAIDEIDPYESETQWDLLKGELVEDGLSKAEIERHKHWIKAKLSELIEIGGLHDQPLLEENPSGTPYSPEKATTSQRHIERPNKILITNDRHFSKDEIERLLADAEKHREDEAEATRANAPFQPTVEDGDEDDNQKENVLLEREYNFTSPSGEVPGAGERPKKVEAERHVSSETVIFGNQSSYEELLSHAKKPRSQEADDSNQQTTTTEVEQNQRTRRIRKALGDRHRFAESIPVSDRNISQTNKQREPSPKEKPAATIVYLNGESSRYQAREEQRQQKCMEEDNIGSRVGIARANTTWKSDYVEEESSGGSDNTYLPSVSPADSISQVGINTTVPMSRDTNHSLHESPGGTKLSIDETAETFRPQTLRFTPPYPRPHVAEPTQYVLGNGQSVTASRPPPTDAGDVEYGSYYEIPSMSSPKPFRISAMQVPTDNLETDLVQRRGKRRESVSRLNLPSAPVPPKKPPVIPSGAMQGSFRSNPASITYMREFAVYISNWNLYNTKFVAHMVARQKRVHELGVIHMGNDTGLQNYLEELEQDNIFLVLWSIERENHQIIMEDYSDLLHGKRKSERGRPPQFQSSTAPTYGGEGSIGLAALSTAGLGALGAKKISNDPRPRSRRGDRHRRDSLDSYNSQESRGNAGLAALETANLAALVAKERSDRHRREIPASYDSRSPLPSKRVAPPPGNMGRPGLLALAAAGLSSLGTKNVLERRRRDSPDSYDSRSPSPDRRQKKGKNVTDYARSGLSGLHIKKAAGRYF